MATGRQNWFGSNLGESANKILGESAIKILDIREQKSVKYYFCLPQIIEKRFRMLDPTCKINKK